MAKVTSKTGLRNYALRALGAPVINIELEETQMEERIDDIIQYYVERHYDGTEERFTAYTVTASDVENGYITMNENTQNVVDVELGVGQLTPHGINVDGFGMIVPNFSTDEKWHMAKTGDMLGFEISKAHYGMTKDLLTPHLNFTYTHATGRLYLQGLNLKPDMVIIIRGYLGIDAEEFTKVYNERFIKKLTVAYFKQQWGANLSKYSGVTLHDGKTLNGLEIYEKASEEIDKLEEDFEERYEMPAGLMVG